MVFSTPADSAAIQMTQGAHRVLAKGEPPSKLVAYVFMVILFGALIFFVYNWWKCRQSRVLEQESDDFGSEFGQDSGFKPSKPYNQGRAGSKRGHYEAEEDDKPSKEI